MKKKGVHPWQGWKFDPLRLERQLKILEKKGYDREILLDVVECLEENKETNE